MARKRDPDQERAERAAGHLQSLTSSAGDLWLESQTRTLDHIDEVTRRWIDAARESLDEMKECSNIGELMRSNRSGSSARCDVPLQTSPNLAG
jgi:hypothetical protein